MLGPLGCGNRARAGATRRLFSAQQLGAPWGREPERRAGNLPPKGQWGICHLVPACVRQHRANPNDAPAVFHPAIRRLEGGGLGDAMVHGGSASAALVGREPERCAGTLPPGSPPPGRHWTPWWARFGALVGREPERRAGNLPRGNPLPKRRWLRNAIVGPLGCASRGRARGTRWQSTSRQTIQDLSSGSACPKGLPPPPATPTVSPPSPAPWPTSKRGLPSRASIVLLPRVAQCCVLVVTNSYRIFRMCAQSGRAPPNLATSETHLANVGQPPINLGAHLVDIDPYPADPGPTM